MIRSVAVVGAGQAGVRAARALRREGFDGTLTLVGDEPRLPYERPPLSKGLLAGDIAPSALRFHDTGWFDEHDIDLRTGVRAVALRPDERAVELDGGHTVTADAVLLATGGRPRWPPGWGADERVRTLRTVEDALALRDRLRPGRHLVVVGGGFIGSEVAATARGLGCEVTLVEALAAPMAGALGTELGTWCARLHRDEGVRVVTDTRVADVAVAGDAAHVRLADADALEADLVLVGLGIVPNTELAEDAGLRVRDGVVVDALGRTSNPGVFAAGDVARHPVPALGTDVRVEHYDNADRQATAVGAAMVGGGEPYDPVHWFWSDQYDYNLQLAGHPAGTDDIVYRGDPASGDFVAFLRADGRLRAAFGVNRGREVLTARRLIRRGHHPTRDELADEDTPLAGLARR